MCRGANDGTLPINRSAELRSHVWAKLLDFVKSSPPSWSDEVPSGSRHRNGHPLFDRPERVWRPLFACRAQFDPANRWPLTKAGLSLARSVQTYSSWGFEGPARGIPTPPSDHTPLRRCCAFPAASVVPYRHISCRRRIDFAARPDGLHYLWIADAIACRTFNLSRLCVGHFHFGFPRIFSAYAVCSPGK